MHNPATRPLEIDHKWMWDGFFLSGDLARTRVRVWAWLGRTFVVLVTASSFSPSAAGARFFLLRVMRPWAAYILGAPGGCACVGLEMMGFIIKSRKYGLPHKTNKRSPSPEQVTRRYCAHIF